MNRMRFSPSVAQRKVQSANRHLVVATLEQCGFQTGGFNTNEHMELFYDIETWEKRTVGYISKGWEDPGFRVGDVIKVPMHRLKAKKELLPMLMNHCATRGVAMTGEKLNRDAFEFHLDSVIYSEGFNQKVLAQVVECLSECAEIVRASIVLAG